MERLEGMQYGGVLVRAERASDQVAIHELVARCFPTPAEAKLVDALRTCETPFISLVAVNANERIVGHVCLTPVRTNEGLRGMGLAPLAVDASSRRSGIGASLVRRGLSECRKQGIGWVVVLGDPAYYSRFGFRPASEFALTDTYGGGQAFQAVELETGSLPRGAGVVHYSDAFAAL